MSFTPFFGLGTGRHLLSRTACEVVGLHHHSQRQTRFCELLLVQIHIEVVLDQKLLGRDMISPD